MRPPIPEPPYRGGCLCGAVRYRVDARPWALNACHCMDCKRLTGATNLLMVLGAREAFSFEGTVERYRKRADSGNEVDIVRCAKCGVRLWHEPLSAPQLVIFAAGTLDDPSWVIPTSHISRAVLRRASSFRTTRWFCVMGLRIESHSLTRSSASMAADASAGR